jgi:hypothetical protein
MLLAPDHTRTARNARVATNHSTHPREVVVTEMATAPRRGSSEGASEHDVFIPVPVCPGSPFLPAPVHVTAPLPFSLELADLFSSGKPSEPGSNRRPDVQSRRFKFTRHPSCPSPPRASRSDRHVAFCQPFDHSAAAFTCIVRLQLPVPRSEH